MEDLQYYLVRIVYWGGRETEVATRLVLARDMDRAEQSVLRWCKIKEFVVDKVDVLPTIVDYSVLDK
jgi:hypothetical protein